MAINYRALRPNEFRLLSIVPPNVPLPYANKSNEEDKIVHCTIHYVQLCQSALRAGADPTPGQIDFGGEIRVPSPEHFTIVPEPQTKTRAHRSKVPSTPTTALGRLAQRFRRRKLGHDGSRDTAAIAQKETPENSPQNFSFFIEEGYQDSDQDATVPYRPIFATSRDRLTKLPHNSLTRYTWGDFVALSYQWGDGQGEIVVDGRRVTVTTNLQAALREIRDMGWFLQQKRSQSDNSERLMLWVDALCINQSDEAEKSIQIGRMGDIYRNAGNVLVWLRDTVRHRIESSVITTDLAVDTMQRLSGYYRTEILEAIDHSPNTMQVHEFREAASFKLDMSLTRVTNAIIANEIDIDDSAWYAVFQFLSNPYWSRLWIIQELAMGQHGMPILCGDGRVTQWRFIRDSALIMTSVSSLLAERIDKFAREHSLPALNMTDLPIDHIAAISELSIYGQRKKLPYIPPNMLGFTRRPGPNATPSVRGTRLLQILALATRANCFMPEDRVWGLLEVPRIRTLAIKKPADGTSMSLFDVYTLFAARCIESGDRPFELQAAGDDEVMTREETTFVERDGRIVSSSNGTQTIAGGMTYSLDVFAYVNGLATGLLLPSWVPHLALHSVLRTHPLFGPFCAGGTMRTVHTPVVKIKSSGRTEASSQGRESHGMATLRLHAVLLDEIISVGAVQKKMTDLVDFESHGHITTVDIKADKAKVGGAAEAAAVRAAAVGSDSSNSVFDTSVVQNQVSPKELAKDETTARLSLAMVLTAGTDVNGNRKITIDEKDLFSIVPSSRAKGQSAVDARLADFIESNAAFRVAGKLLKEYFPSPAFRGSKSTNRSARQASSLNDTKLKQSMAAKIWGRRLAISKVNGALCLVPMATRVGDQIWVVPGHPRPVILRRMFDITDSAYACHLVGECYVDGIMDGELDNTGLLGAHGTVLLF